MNLPFDGKALWIWSADAGLESGSVASVVHFRRSFQAQPCSTFKIHVSADSRYLLWLNGKLLGRGPAKGDPKHWPYDGYDCGNHVIEGENVLESLVVSFASSWPDYALGGSPVSLISMAPGFILDGKVTDQAGKVLEDISTDRRWLASKCNGIRFIGRKGIPCAGPGEESELNTDGPAGAEVYLPALESAPGVRPDTVDDSPRPHRLIPRRIPFLPEESRSFASAWDEAGFKDEGAEASLLAGRWIEVCAGQKAQVMLDAGAITSGYPNLDLEGKGLVKLFYGERLQSPDGVVRDASLPHDKLTGPMFDQVRISKGKASWYPIFWRAFRFLRLEVEAGDIPLKIRLTGYSYTAYPYHALPPFRSSDKNHLAMDEVAWRTLRLCSHETFEDCPYYEQLQYAGDVQVQARTAYFMAGDTALARQAMLHFAESINDEGLTASRWPSRVPQLIPLWSLHWVLSLAEYYNYTEDKDTVRMCLPGALRILDWFMERRDTRGLIGFLPYWKVADWCKQWPGGVPPGMEKGPSAISNFMVIAALRAAVRLCKDTGKVDKSITRSREAEKLAGLSHKAFWNNSKGLYRDRPAEPSEVSQMTNAWAIVSGVAPKNRLKKISDNVMTQPGLCEAAWFGKSFLFDALMKACRPDLAEKLLEPYRELLPKGFTTWPEDPSYGRSECHGWSNLPGLAFRRLYLGVSIEGLGCKDVRIAPWPGSLTFAEGTVMLMQGELRVSWRKEGDRFKADVNLPAGVSAVFISPNGRKEKMQEGPNRIEERL